MHTSRPNWFYSGLIFDVERAAKPVRDPSRLHTTSGKSLSGTAL
jgi:hypothetical protein